jgi:hypothetical protein
LLSFVVAGRVFAFAGLIRFTFARGVAFALTAPVFAFARFVFVDLFALTALFVFPFVLPLAFSLVFLGRGRLGLFSLFAEALVLRFSLGSSGVTFSDDSPAFATRLMSIATVWPVLTTSPARGN